GPHVGGELLRDDRRRHAGAQVADVIGETLYQPRRRTTSGDGTCRNVRHLMSEHDPTPERRQLPPVARVDRDPIAHRVGGPGTVLHLGTRDRRDLAQVAGIVDDLRELVLRRRNEYDDSSW